jgi:tetratricopeptide (TPR) repeat protein
MPSPEGVVSRRPRRRALLVAAGSVATVAGGAVTNIITSRFSWWLFATLAALVILTVVLVVALDENADGWWKGRVRSIDPPSAEAATSINTLPRDISDFTGRESETAVLLAAAREGTRRGHEPLVCSVEGIGGVGKTSLAVRVGYELAGSFPDAVLFVDLHAHTEGQPPVTAGQALGTLLADLGVAGSDIPDSLDGRISAWRRRLLGSRALVILDNASDADQVKDILAGGPGCMFIITSRQRINEIPGILCMQLDALPPADATALAGRIIGTAVTGREAADAARLVARTGGLPLAVRLTAVRLRSHPAWTVDDLLRHDITHLPELERAYARSYQDLAPAMKNFFRMLSVHPGTEITAEAAAVLTGTSLRAASANLEELYNQYLLTEPTANRYKFHDRIKDFVTAGETDMTEATAREGALLRLLAYYAFTAESASVKIGAYTRFGSPPPDMEIPVIEDRAAATEWLSQETGNLLSCASYAIDKRLLPAAWRIPAALAYYLRMRGFLSQAIALLDGALAVVQEEDDPLGEIVVRLYRGQFARLRGDLPSGRTHLGRALELAEQTGDRQLTAWSQHELGHLNWVAGDLAAAEQNFTQAADLHRALGNSMGVAGAELNLGPVLYARSEREKGIATLADALRAYRDAADDRGIAAALYRQGEIERDSGDHASAREKLSAALQIYDETRNRQGRAECLLNLAAIDRLEGSYELARQLVNEALEICVELGFRRGEADAYAEMSALCAATDDEAMSVMHRQHAETLYADLHRAT